MKLTAILSVAVTAVAAEAATPSFFSEVVLSDDYPVSLPTHSRCQTLCPGCDTTDCECDACWPGTGLDDTPDKTCNCFGTLGFCKEGEEPEFKKGEKCPSCWPAENKACDCFAVTRWCDADYPAPLPTHSQCATLCPGCDTPDCKCDACWPGTSLADTPDKTCECFAELGFCKEGEKPEYDHGEKCPSCWPADNHACDCFAVLGFCDAPQVATTTTLATGADELKAVTFASFSPTTAESIFMLTCGSMLGLALFIGLKDRSKVINLAGGNSPFLVKV